MIVELAACISGKDTSGSHNSCFPQFLRCLKEEGMLNSAKRDLDDSLS